MPEPAASSQVLTTDLASDPWKNVIEKVLNFERRVPPNYNDAAVILAETADANCKLRPMPAAFTASTGLAQRFQDIAYMLGLIIWFAVIFGSLMVGCALIITWAVWRMTVAHERIEQHVASIERIVIQQSKHGDP